MQMSTFSGISVSAPRLLWKGKQMAKRKRQDGEVDTRWYNAGTIVHAHRFLWAFSPHSYTRGNIYPNIFSWFLLNFNCWPWVCSVIKATHHSALREILNTCFWLGRVKCSCCGNVDTMQRDASLTVARFLQTLNQNYISPFQRNEPLTASSPATTTYAHWCMMYLSPGTIVLLWTSKRGQTLISLFTSIVFTS